MIFTVLIWPETSEASESSAVNKDLPSEWGGHVRGRGGVSWPDRESIYDSVQPGPYYDGSGELRLKNTVFLGDWGHFETHYETVLSGGDTRRAELSLARLYPTVGLMDFGGPPDDRLRLMNLTGIIDENDDYVLYHRLDRLSLTVRPKWGTVRVGRQVLTWGNGLVFNPMDLFNPFAPTDVERDYKVGDDMVTVQFPLKTTADLQFLYVPRRDPVTHDVTWDASSVAGKWHFAMDTTEFDLMGSKHYEDFVAGLGSTRYLGDAACRMDVIWTFLNEENSQDGFFSLVANIDYSWVWLGKNIYGLMEFYFNDLGTDAYEEAYANPDIARRLQRGEMYTLGRTYLAGEVQVELHPLFSAYLTVINNLSDPSGIVQPRAVWNTSQDVQITFGGNIFYGRTGTEYGGFSIPSTTLFNQPPNSVFLWLTYFF